MRRRSPAITVVLAVIALVLLPTISNIEANALPPSWTPMLWIAWPAGFLLAAPLVYFEVRHWHHDRESDPEQDKNDERQRLDRAVADLAAGVLRQWTNEMGRRSARSAIPLRVRWSTTERPVAPNLAGVVGPDVPHRPKAVRGDTAEHVVTLLDSLKDRQLVILGEPGAGKTVLAVRFVLQQLEQRDNDDPLPVLLAMSSWDPAAEDLLTWLARRIVEEYPALGNAHVYGARAAKAMVARGRILAVLDGLDEMPVSTQPLAIAALNRAATAGYPMVVTCRSQEYQDAVTGHGEFLSRAAALEIQPVDLVDAGRYLIAAAPAGSSCWQPVLDELSVRPDAPLATVLTSPLMIGLARAVYAGSTSSPKELLDAALFRTPDQIESHLLDAFVQVAYPDTPNIPDIVLIPHYPPQRARAWLTFLAGYLRDQQTGELAWWHLFRAMPRIGLALCVGVPIGMLVGSADDLVTGADFGITFGITYAVAATLSAAVAGPRQPTRVQLRFHATTRAFLARFVGSSAVGIAMALASHLRVLPAMGLGLGFGLTFAAQVWMDAPTDATERPTPDIALRQNRTATIGFALTVAAAIGVFLSAGLAVGGPQSFAVTGPLPVYANALIGMAASGWIGYLGYRWTGLLMFSLAAPTAFGLTVWMMGSLHNAIVDRPVPPHMGMTSVWFGIAYGLAVGVAGFASRAWGGFCIARFWLAVRGKLPWRLMRFLDDAHRRGVLRQSGAVYQFRHARLRDRLAEPR
jgi:hypothetical protein